MQRKIFIAFLSALLSAMLLTCPDVRAEASPKALTNQDVARMVASGLPESVVVSTIQAGPTQFDTSIDALIALHKAGASKAVLDAVVGAGTSRRSQANESATTTTLHPGATAVATASTSISGSPPPPRSAADSGSDLPAVMLVQGSNRVPIPLERTHLAETKSKPTSMAGLASDAALTQSMQTGVSTVAMATVMHTGSVSAGSVALVAGSVFSNMIPHPQPTVTYVWGVPTTSSVTQVETTNRRLGFTEAIVVAACLDVPVARLTATTSDHTTRDIAFSPDGRMFFSDDTGGHVFWMAPTTLMVPGANN